MPLAGFYHKLCWFSSAFCCSQLCLWHNPPWFFSQVKENTDIKGGKAADVKPLIKCSTTQKSLWFFSFIFLSSPSPPPKCALGFYEPVTNLMIDLNALKSALPWDSLCKSQRWGDPILLLHVGFSSRLLQLRHWDSDFERLWFLLYPFSTCCVMFRSPWVNLEVPKTHLERGFVEVFFNILLGWDF